MQLNIYNLKAFSLTIFLLGCSLFASSARADVTIVTSGGMSDPLVNFLTNNFTNVGTITTGLFQTGAPTLGVNDIVIVTRNSDSGDYAADATEIDSWNGLTNNLIVLSGFTPRSNRWGWIDSTGVSTVSSAGNETDLTSAGLVDPLFNDITIDLSNAADLHNIGGTGGNINQLTANGSVGGGDLLAINGTGIAVARWSAGDALADTTPGDSNFAVTNLTHGGDRIYFGMSALGLISDLTPDGQQLLINALTEAGLTPVPEPSTGLLAVIGMLGVGYYRRRLKATQSA